MTSGLPAALVPPAAADVVDPYGRQLHTTVICDSSAATFSLLVAPETDAVVRVVTRAIETGFEFHVPDLYPVESAPGHTLYQFTLGSGRYALHLEYWWQDANGTWYSAGEWADDYIDPAGVQQHECRL